MLMPDPRHVRTLLARYASARIALSERSASPTWQQELEDVTNALCAATGTASITDALTAADLILANSAQAKKCSTTGAPPDTAMAA